MVNIIYLVCVCVCSDKMTFTAEYTCQHCSCTVKYDSVLYVDEHIKQQNDICLQKYVELIDDFENKIVGQDEIKESFNFECEKHNSKWYNRLAFWNKRKVIFENEKIKIVDYYNEKRVRLQYNYFSWFHSSPATPLIRPYKYLLCPVCDGKKWVKEE